MDAKDTLTERQKGFLPDYIGLEWLEARAGFVRGRLAVKKHHMAPNGFLHAASVIALVDSACGYGCVISKPDEVVGFTTIELKCNFLGTVRDGAITCDARLVHGGRTTQIWDAEAKDEATSKTIALFRCTQMLLYPK